MELSDWRSGEKLSCSFVCIRCRLNPKSGIVVKREAAEAEEEDEREAERPSAKVSNGGDIFIAQMISALMSSDGPQAQKPVKSRARRP